MSNISGIIKSIRDIMRKDTGVDGDAQRISQMVWMIFMKIFADKEEEWSITLDDYESPLPKYLKWQSWAADDEGDTGDKLMEFINNSLFPTLKELDPTLGPQAAIIRSVFEDTYNYMKNGTLFRQVINEINKIDFNDQKDRHLFNDIYETILKELQSAGSSGEYYTPRGVTRFMIDIIDPQKDESILDPACGTGGFLVNSIKNIREKSDNYKPEEIQGQIRGIEKKPLPHLLCTTNLMLNGFDVPVVKRDNYLSKPYNDWGAKDKVDIIVSNPPFGGIEEDGTELNFPSRLRTKETADLFLALIIKLLKNGGRAALVLPDGSFYGDGVKQRIREEFLTKCNLHTIIRLPNSVFKPYASVATNLLFFTKGTPTTEVWYFEHQYPKGLKSYSKTNPIKYEEFDKVKKWWNKRQESTNAWKVSIAELEERGYDLDIKNPNKEINHKLFNGVELINEIKITNSSILNKLEYLEENKLDITNYELKTIGEICNVVKGKTGIKKAIPGKYQLVVTAEERLTHSEFQFDTNAVCIPLVSSSGHGHASLKRVHFQSGKFALGSILAAVTPKDNTYVSAKYLYYYLNTLKDELLVPLMKGMANVSLSVTKIKSVEIRIPSIEDQLKLVNRFEKCEEIVNGFEENKKTTNKVMLNSLFKFISS